MLSERDLINISIDLRRKLADNVKYSLLNRDDISLEQILYVSSITVSSLLAQMSSLFFDFNTEICKEYIDDVCNAAKLQLDDINILRESGMQ